MPDTDAGSLMALKFELALTIGDSLDLVPMVRRFIVPLLQAVKGLGCQVWLYSPDAAAGPPIRVAYPQRSLRVWDQDPALTAWIAEGMACPGRMPPQHRSARGTWLHALPVGEEGVLVIEHASEPVSGPVLDAVTVLLMRLAKACRACHDHAQARRLLVERERAERDRLLATQRMQEVLALSGDGFVYFDEMDCIALCNPAVGPLLGPEPALLLGLTAAQLDVLLQGVLAPGEPAPGFAQHLQAVVQAADSPAGAEAQTEVRRGRLQLAAQGVASPVRVVDWSLRRTQNSGRAVLYLRDVTHETEVDRMKSEFLTTAAHELRTPMVSVFGFTELLLNRPVPEGRRREVLETIHRQASLLIKMVNELLDLARIEARQGKDLQRRDARLTPLLQQTVDSLLVKDDPRSVCLSLRHPDATASVDPEKFQRALTNVLSNAFKYSPDGGAITLETLDGTLAGQQAVGIRVRDNGIGMNETQCARVFERFYRADPSGHIPGTGLGMSLTHEIVTLHGGRVDVESAPGEGTSVTLWWPLLDAQAG